MNELYVTMFNKSTIQHSNFQRLKGNENEDDRMLYKLIKQIWHGMRTTNTKKNSQFTIHNSHTYIHERQS